MAGPSPQGVLVLLCSALAFFDTNTCAHELGRGPAYTHTHGNNDTSKAILFLNARKQAYSRHKLPIARPRLRTTTPEPSDTVASFFSTTEHESDYEPIQENTQVKRQAVFDTVLKQADIFELSSSDFSPAVAWPVPRRPASRRFRHNTLTVSSTAKPLLKLMRPKPTRPPAYSLDGFVPKPSMIRVSSTQAPVHIQRAYVKTDAPASSRNTLKKRGYRKNKTKPLSNDDDDDGNVGRKSSYKRKTSSSRTMMNRTPRKGVPGVDFPTFSRVPVTTFDCDEKPFPGMYADPDADCQVWHMCTGVPNLGARHSFLCPNGTIFNERRGVCDWWYNVDCNDTEP